MTKEINLTWCVEDVLGVEPSLTEKEAGEVLEAIERNHDPEIGVTWDTIEHYAREKKMEIIERMHNDD